MGTIDVTPMDLLLEIYYKQKIEGGRELRVLPGKYPLSLTDLEEVTPRIID